MGNYVNGALPLVGWRVKREAGDVRDFSFRASPAQPPLLYA